VRVIDIFSNTHQHTIQVPGDLIVPEAQHTIALLLQGPGSFRICSLPFHVLTTVQFNHQVPFWATEVDNVTGCRVLATELHSVNMPGSQV
jgi:hypothetical protein